MMPYEKFEAWRRCHALVLAVYAATGNWPKAELYGLVSQTRRAAVSAPTNIAEGASKRGKAEFRRFLGISLGSLAELSYLLLLAKELGFLSPTEAQHLEEQRTVASKMTYKLYASLGA